MITQTGLVRPPPPLRGYQLETFCKMKFRLVSCPSAAKISARGARQLTGEILALQRKVNKINSAQQMQLINECNLRQIFKNFIL